jgi:outer membrane protein OmpA-like peptidoglycan-associated protein
MNYFIEMGINPRQISSEGKGEKVPVATNETEDGRQLNRRTEIRIEK